MTTMFAYHNNPTLKRDTIAAMRDHREHDRLMKGQYWEGGKGCAIGCMTGGDRHDEYPSRWGIPVELAHLEDAIFEGLPNSKSQRWPERFLAAIEPGADLSMVWPRFALWILTDGPARNGLGKDAAVDRAVAEVAALYREWIRSGKKPDKKRWTAARVVAEGTAEVAAEVAAEAAAEAAWATTWAARVARAAARAAAGVARGAVWGPVWDAAWAAAWAAGAARVAGAAAGVAAWDVARGAAWEKMAAELLRLLKAAPVAKPKAITRKRASA